MGAQLIGGERRTFLEQDRHRHLLAESLVGHAEHRSLVHTRVFVDRSLDLCAVHVLASTQDHVFDAVFDVDEALLVEPAEVTGAQPAINEGLGGRVRTVPVPADQIRPLEPDLAMATDGQRLVVAVADLDLHDRHDPTRTRRLLGVVVATVARSICVGLGHAVTDGRLAAGEAVGNLGDQRRRRWGTSPADVAQARRVELGKARRLDEIPTLRRHADEVRDLLTLDDLKRLVDVPLEHDDELHPTCEAAEHHRHTTGDVEQRHDQNERRWVRRRFRWLTDPLHCCPA